MHNQDAGAPVSGQQVLSIVRRALKEDLPWGDITTEALVPAEACSRGLFIVKNDGVVCGLAVVGAVFRELDPSLVFQARVHDGQQVVRGDVIAEVQGRTRPILAGERTALNMLQRMSGIATETARYVAAVSGSGATIVDTRKTAPGLRFLDKYAVRCGGGSNHRFCLSDGVLVKDNHLAALGERSGEALTSVLQAARSSMPHTTRLEVEVDRLDQIASALAGGADIILLDNMGPEQLRQAVELIAGRALTEASGGVTLESVAEIAGSGVDLISVGALTHSVKALDVGLDLVAAPW